MIYPGDIISLVYIDGRPRLTLERNRNVKLSPGVKVLPHSEAIPALPLDVINNFLTRNRVVTQEEVDGAPSVATNMPNKTDKYENKLLLNAIGFDPVDMDTLVERTGLSVVELNRQLMELQLEGIISNQNGLYDRLE